MFADFVDAAESVAVDVLTAGVALVTELHTFAVAVVKVPEKTTQLRL